MPVVKQSRRHQDQVTGAFSYLQRESEGHSISVEDVSISYPSREGSADPLVVSGISFKVPAGGSVGIIGPSGCGKTSLLKAIAGFIRPREGTISVNGTLVRGPSRRRVVVFQDFEQLFQWRTVAGNIRYALQLRAPNRRKRFYGGSRDRSSRDQVDRLLEMVNLGGYGDRYPCELSGGMKQRVALARALALEPEVLLLDEPFGALDAITRAKLQEELLLLWRKTRMTIVLVTHSLEEALLLGDQVLVMSAGPPSRCIEIVETPGRVSPESETFKRVMATVQGWVSEREGQR